MNDGRVHYELMLRFNKASAERFLRAAVAHKAQMRDGYFFDDKLLVALLRIEPARTASFCEAVKIEPGELKYRPPTRFDNGALRPIYASPAEELAARGALDILSGENEVY